ncbi:RBPJ-interacting and tubulin-associated protein 1 [Leptonychotes weddellii]|uniref:RBPJ-interacting and tubulin-associated protein 1 n=1 Tax=Leptonychotes weddellii TaxID=9713 RepID=A0A7F8QCW2_LEPWE|nr:RBPJ-interacting and tubulin-associated protein 1 [Leptonychotes weddellii]
MGMGLFIPPAHCISLPFSRLISHTPSYCDESLFGSRPEGTSWEGPWMAKGDAAKLHALFWTPPATPRGSHSPRPRETPLRAIHPAGPSKTEPEVVADSRKLSIDGLDSPHPQRRERSHSLTCLNVPSTGRPPASAPHTNGPRDPRPSLSGVTFQSPLVTPRACSVRISLPATPQQGGATQKPKPPWK